MKDQQDALPKYKWNGTSSIKVATFNANRCQAQLDVFGKTPYGYKGKSLFVDYGNGLVGNETTSELFLADHVKNSGSIVPLSPDICGSFAIWPPCGGKDDNLLTVCQKEVLRPQFVFLALNWSSKITHAGNEGNLDSPKKYFDGMPRWNNFHNLSRDTRMHKKSHLEESFECNPLRGAYMTDFAKGIVSTDSTGVYKFLNDDKSKIKGLDVCPFMGFVEILQQELKALDEVFGISGVPKFLIIYGPTIYNNLQSMSRKYAGSSLDALFPDRTILRTGSFYNNVRGLTVQDYHNQLRQLYFPQLAGLFSVEDLKFTPAR